MLNRSKYSTEEIGSTGARRQKIRSGGVLHSCRWDLLLRQSPRGRLADPAPRVLLRIPALNLPHRNPRIPSVIRDYLDRALRRASYEKLPDGTYVGEVPGLRGVIATAPTLEACRDLLIEVVEEWVLVRVSRGLSVPAIDGVKLAVVSK